MNSKRQHPPKWADKIMSWLLSEKVIENLQGDLHELYRKRLAKKGRLIADVFYLRDLLDLCRPFALKRIKSTSNMNIHRHTLKMHYRSIMRYKSSFAINIIGLTTGLACALLIYLWVADEYNMNQFNERGQRIVQILTNVTDETNTIRTGGYTTGILADAMAAEIPEVEYAAAVVPPEWFAEDGVLEYGDKKLKTKTEYAGKDYTRIFTIDFLKGNPAAPLDDKYSMMMSEEMAIKMFGSVDEAIGKSVSYMDNVVPVSFHVTAVYRNASNNSSPAPMILNIEVFLDAHPWLREWGNADPSTYVLLKEGTDINVFNSKIKDFLKRKVKDSRNALTSQRFSEHYLFGHFENGVPSGGRIEYVRLFILIAIFILTIACINFMNLATARASRRLKEVGIKKTIGASRASLFIQHMEESLLTAFLSMIVAVTLVFLVLPEFNNITGKHLTLVPNGPMVLSSLAIVLFTGLLAGSYPAFYLSGFRPAEVLKGKLHTSWSELLVRKGLVVFQFVISVFLTVCVVVVYAQIQFVQSKNLGYDRSNMLHFDAGIERFNAQGKSNMDDPDFFAEGGSHEKQMETLLNQIRTVPGIVNATNYEHDLTGRHGGMQGVSWKEGKEDDEMNFNNLQVGNNFIPTMGIQLAEGRSFSADKPGETSKVLFNEEAIKAMGLHDPIGKIVQVWGKDKEIIGVAKNFHIESLFEPVRATIIQLEPRSTRIMVRIEKGKEKEAIAGLEKIYNSRTPGLSFDYSFVDDDYNALYASEERVSVLAGYFSVLTILISALGLFGLSAFTAERRKKEIGIRKVLGSTESSIVLLLSGEFSKIILIAVVIALPISFIVMQNWIHTFAYGTPLKWWFFAVAAAMAIVVPLFAVGFQTLKASVVSPLQSLKEE